MRLFWLKSKAGAHRCHLSSGWRLCSDYIRLEQLLSSAAWKIRFQIDFHFLKKGLSQPCALCYCDVMITLPTLLFSVVNVRCVWSLWQPATSRQTGWVFRCILVAVVEQRSGLWQKLLSVTSFTNWKYEDLNIPRALREFRDLRSALERTTWPLNLWICAGRHVFRPSEQQMAV